MMPPENRALQAILFHLTFRHSDLAPFGLVEYRGENEGTDAGTGMSHAWRKSALFDRFLGFEVRLEGAGAARY